MHRSFTGLMVLFLCSCGAYFAWVQVVTMFFAIPAVEQTITSEIIVVGPADCGGCIKVIVFDPKIAKPIGTPQLFEEIEITVLDVIEVKETERPVAGRKRWDIRVRFYNTSINKSATIRKIADQVQDTHRFYEYGEILDGSSLADGETQLPPQESLEVTYTYWIDEELDEVYWLYAEQLGLNEENRLYARDLVAVKINLE